MASKSIFNLKIASQMRAFVVLNSAGEILFERVFLSQIPFSKGLTEKIRSFVVNKRATGNIKDGTITLKFDQFYLTVSQNYSYHSCSCVLWIALPDGKREKIVDELSRKFEIKYSLFLQTGSTDQKNYDLLSVIEEKFDFPLAFHYTVTPNVANAIGEKKLSDEENILITWLSQYQKKPFLVDEQVTNLHYDDIGLPTEPEKLFQLFYGLIQKKVLVGKEGRFR